MKILYIAKHGSGGGDDEGAIAHALQQLGHEVTCLQESSHRDDIIRTGADLLLFHKWDDTDTLKAWANVWIKSAVTFWYFDLVDFPSDPTLARRCNQRKDWMRRITPLVDVGFCTDGDWVIQDKTEKLTWLTQGADERVVGRGTPGTHWKPTILFTGIGRGGGITRESFVHEMSLTYGEKLHHVSKGLYGRRLANRIAEAQVVVAPDSPITDYYWSNRVYNALGFGGFLLHPHCEGLTKHYREYEEIAYYRSRDELHQSIDRYLGIPTTCREIGEAGLKRTLTRHLYRHRCEILIRTLQERGLVP